MLKLIICEFRKLKRKKLFYAAFLTSVLMPFFYAVLLPESSLDDMMSVVKEENGFLILIPLAVITAANLFFEEHDHDTLKNLVCIPVSKSRLAAAKLTVILLFTAAYQLAGYGITVLMAVILRKSLFGWELELFLTFGTGILLFAAAMPCILLVVWCNKSYIISVILAFAYTVLGYILHLSEPCLMVPLGLNPATFLPVPMIFRWLYQFHMPENGGAEFLAFYNRFRPYFVPTPVVFAVLTTEAAVCTVLIAKVYQKQGI